MVGVTVPGVFGIVAFVLSYGILVPNDLRVLCIIAAIGAIAGQSCAKLMGAMAKKRSCKIWQTILLSNVCVIALVAYTIYLNTNPSGVAAVCILSILMFVAFFTFAALVGVSGIQLAGADLEANQE